MKVCTHLLSSINFCYTKNACCLPKIQGILYFACGAQYTLFNMNSHIRSTSTYSTVYSTLWGLSDSKAQLTEALGWDPNSWLILCLNNMQSYTRRRDLWIGQVNQLRIGTAATAIEAEDFHPAAMDIDDQSTRIVENKQKDMMVPSLLALVDNTHANLIGALQWLCILAHYVPELSKRRPRPEIWMECPTTTPTQMRRGLWRVFGVPISFANFASSWTLHRAESSEVSW